MTRGPYGYGHYDDDPAHVVCPRAKSDMTPCIARDGHLALAGETGSGRRDCVGCFRRPDKLVGELANAGYEPARGKRPDGVPSAPDGRAFDIYDGWADLLAGLVRDATEPLAEQP